MELDGQVSSDRILTLKFSCSGRLSYLNYQIGQIVKKGQLLARLDQTEFQNYLDRSLKYYEQVRADFDEKQTKSLNEFDRRKLQAELDVSVKNVEIAKINLEDSNLYAPIDGLIVASDPIAVGINITPAGFVITLLDHNSFHFQASVAETELEKINLEASAIIKLTAFPARAITGKVKRIDFIADKKNQYPVIISLDDQESLRLGLTGKAKIDLQQKTVKIKS